MLGRFLSSHRLSPPWSVKAASILEKKALKGKNRLQL